MESSVERGAGFAYQLTYDVSELAVLPGAGAFQLSMHRTPNSVFGTSIKYSPCPTEMELADSNSRRAILIPFD